MNNALRQEALELLRFIDELERVHPNELRSFSYRSFDGEPKKGDIASFIRDRCRAISEAVEYVSGGQAERDLRELETLKSEISKAATDMSQLRAQAIVLEKTLSQPRSLADSVVDLMPGWLRLRLDERPAELMRLRQRQSEQERRGAELQQHLHSLSLRAEATRILLQGEDPLESLRTLVTSLIDHVGVAVVQEQKRQAVLAEQQVVADRRAHLEEQRRIAAEKSLRELSEIREWDSRRPSRDGSDWNWGVTHGETD